MIVLITNVTDAPGKNPTQVDIYNKTLSPGSQIKIPADLVTKKLRSLEQSGLIAIGNLPPWYVTAKKRSKPLSEADRQKRQVNPPASDAIPLKREKKKDKEIEKPFEVLEGFAAKKG